MSILTEDIKLNLIRRELREIICNCYNIPHYVKIEFDLNTK